MAVRKRILVKEVTKDTTKDLDTFLQTLMAPPKKVSERMLGDITAYESINPSDMYTVRVLLPLLKSPIAYKALRRIRGIQDFKVLLVPDFLMTATESDDIKQGMEQALSDEHYSLEQSVRRAAQEFCSRFSEEERSAQKQRLLDLMKQGYIQKNQGEIKNKLLGEYNESSEIRAVISRRTRLSTLIASLIGLGMLAAFTYFGIRYHQEQLSLHQQYTEHVQTEYNIEVPEHLNKGLIDIINIKGLFWGE